MSHWSPISYGSVGPGPAAGALLRGPGEDGASTSGDEDDQNLPSEQPDDKPGPGGEEVADKPAAGGEGSISTAAAVGGCVLLTLVLVLVGWLAFGPKGADEQRSQEPSGSPGTARQPPAVVGSPIAENTAVVAVPVGKPVRFIDFPILDHDEMDLWGTLSNWLWMFPSAAENAAGLAKGKKAPAVALQVRSKGSGGGVQKPYLIEEFANRKWTKISLSARIRWVRSDSFWSGSESAEKSPVCRDSPRESNLVRSIQKD